LKGFFRQSRQVKKGCFLKGQVFSRIFYIYFFIFCFLSVKSFGQKAEFIREHSYIASNDDSRNSAKAKAIQEAQTSLLQELGVVVEARQNMNTVASGNRLQQDFTEELKTYTIGKIQTSVVDGTEKFTQTNLGAIVYSATFNMVVDTADLRKYLDGIVKQKQQAITDSLQRAKKMSEIQNRAKADSLAKANKISKEIKANRNNNFLFSIRPEFVFAGIYQKDTVFSDSPKDTSVIRATANGVGASMELGAIISEIFYFTTELSGGMRYFGGWLNAGACFDFGFPYVVGVSAGFHNTLLPVEFKRNDKILASKNGQNISFAGIFSKHILGNEGNLDITNKILFGYKKNPVAYNQSGKEFVYDGGFNFTYILSVGYTFIKNKR
jgi:hypothetical protein